ncbi:response regulator transcription factor [Gracilibacillus halophilus]|uniref:response regulator transcription factor n=1 Tax=Gracilibacillus halophilus TaxID=470864 RepID=UPI003B82C98D
MYSRKTSTGIDRTVKPYRHQALSLQDALDKRGVHLTPTELQIATLLSEGKSNQDISSQLYLSIGTVKNYVSKVYRKISVSNRSEAILFFKRIQTIN